MQLHGSELKCILYKVEYPVYYQLEYSKSQPQLSTLYIIVDASLRQY